MKAMKKILVGSLAALMLLGLTACGKTCKECGKTIKGDGYEYKDEVYCDVECAGKAFAGDLVDALS